MENEDGELKLKSDAVPTIFVFKPTHKKRKSYVSSKVIHC